MAKMSVALLPHIPSRSAAPGTVSAVHFATQVLPETEWYASHAMPQPAPLQTALPCAGAVQLCVALLVHVPAALQSAASVTTAPEQLCPRQPIDPLG